jgi:hypothetical protein
VTTSIKLVKPALVTTSIKLVKPALVITSIKLQSNLVYWPPLLSYSQTYFSDHHLY